MNAFESKIKGQITELDRSQGHIKKEINNFFNLDDMNFSVIGSRPSNREESEMFDLHNIKQQITGSVI